MLRAQSSQKNINKAYTPNNYLLTLREKYNAQNQFSSVNAGYTARLSNDRIKVPLAQSPFREYNRPLRASKDGYHQSSSLASHLQSQYQSVQNKKTVIDQQAKLVLNDKLALKIRDLNRNPLTELSLRASIIPTNKLTSKQVNGILIDNLKQNCRFSQLKETKNEESPIKLLYHEEEKQIKGQMAIYQEQKRIVRAQSSSSLRPSSIMKVSQSRLCINKYQKESSMKVISNVEKIMMKIRSTLNS